MAAVAAAADLIAMALILHEMQTWTRGTHGQQEEYGDSGHHVNKHVEQDLLAGALLFALELFKLKCSFERDENKSQEELNTQGITFLPKKAPSVPMRMPLMGIPTREYASKTPRPSCVCGADLPYPIVVMEVNAK